MSRIKLHESCEATPIRNSLLWDRKTIRLAGLVSVFFLLGSQALLGQESAELLSPTESYKAALAPFTETRSQANDLTDADKLALSIGIARASRDCLALSSDVSSFSSDAKELFALGQLCIFGRQFETARTILVDFLALPQPPDREQALLLLVRAFLGLNVPDSAAAQVRTLLLDFPYDALIHAAIGQVIDSVEGDSAYPDDLIRELCLTQNAATLPLLRNGMALEGKNGSVSAATLFTDAVRCEALSQSGVKPNSLEALASIALEPRWTGTADLTFMQAALARQLMVGKSVPLTSLHGNLPAPSSLVPRTVSLEQGTALLIPFTLWSPSTPEVAFDLKKLSPHQPIYAITSWHANSGREDIPSSEVLKELRAWQRDLPKQVLILIVPDSVLRKFHSVVFPGGILIRDGTVLSNIPLSSKGAERLLVKTLATKGGAH
jgi:hypothetical protein